MSTPGEPFGLVNAAAPGGLEGQGSQLPGGAVADGPAAGGPLPGGQRPGGQGDLGLPRLPGFREMALRRMAGERRRLVGELTAQRKAAGLSQTQVAARMGTSQSAVARLEAGEADVRASTLERYAAAIGSQISWRLQDPPPAGQLPLPGPAPGLDLDPGLGQPSRPQHFGSPGLRPPAGPLAPAAQHQPYGPRQEDSHDRSRG
jgi:transcriptional regulator with XRE-family HTH domain